MTFPARYLNRPALQFAAMMAILSLVLIAQHGDKDWSAPLRYYGDNLSYGVMVRQVLEEGWFPWTNDRLGAPFGANSLDYPVSDGANYLILHLLGLFGGWVFVFNGFLVASYFTVAAAAFWALSRMGFAGPWPLVGGLLFTLLPYHPLRCDHLFLTAYHAVPLGAWLAWTVWTSRDAPSPRTDLATWFCAVVVGASGIYYAFFACFLVVVAMLANTGSVGWARAWRRGAVVLAIAGATVLANVMPSIVYKALRGPNLEVAIRPYSDTERYGLKIIQLVLPRANHRVEAADSVNVRYGTVSELVNENVTASLGMLGVIGFFFLLWHLLRRLYGVAQSEPLAGSLAAFALSTTLLGTIGGFGALFSFFVSAQIRAYNRISVLIGFIAIAGFLLLARSLLERAGGAGRLGRSLASPWAPWAVAAAILAVGIAEQTSPKDLKQVRGGYDSDRELMAKLEAQLPRAAMVYQMPYQRYPEAGDQFGMENYGPARGYLNSRELRWSYGHIKGREGDRWMTTLKQLPVPRQVAVVSQSGFDAILVDRRGFADRGKSTEESLQRLLGAPIGESPDGQLAAYRVVPTGKQTVSYEDLQMPFESMDFSVAQLPVSVARLSGMSPREPWGRWTEGPVMRMELVKPLPREFVLEIQTLMAMPTSADVPIAVVIGGAERTFTVSTKLNNIRLPFRLAEEAASIEIRIPRPASPAELGISGDPRKLGIGIKSIALKKE